MANLIPFNPDAVPKKRSAKKRALDPPPADALERASWLHDLLCCQLHDALADDTATAQEKRTITASLGAKIIAAMPHHEIAAARDEIRKAESAAGDDKKPGLGGTVQRATTGGTRPLRSAAPRGKG